MTHYLKYLPFLVCLLFLKDVALVICSTDNPLYWIENVEETEQKSDNKEKEEKKETDDKKFSVASNFTLSNQLSFAALHIISERKYASPSFEVVVPPPERA